MSPFVIPAVFQAIDKFSGPVSGMGKAIDALGGKAAAAASRMERAFNRVHQKAQSLATSTGAAGLAVAAPLGLILKAASDFETGLASFRTIVSDLSDKDFEPFRAEVFRVAKDTKKSATDVVSSFEKIAGLNADFAKTAEGLGQVSTAAITLAKASGDELGASAESLVGIMNQFGFAASQADKSINVLAAGQAVGAANISQTAEALKIFGAVAKGSNTTIEQSVALIETLAAKSIMGSEAGTALRGSFIHLQKAGLGYKSGQFQINDALEEAKHKFDGLKSAKQRDAYVTKLFGLENITAGRIMLDSIQTYKDFTTSVTGTSEAQKAAAINSNTMASKLQQLKDQAMNLAITFGSSVMPTISGMLDAIRPIIDGIGAWIDKNPELAKTTFMVAGAVALLLLFTSLLSGVIAAITSPLGLVVGALAALAVVVVDAYKSSDSFRNSVNDLWESIKPLIESIWNLVQAVWRFLKPVFGAIGKIILDILEPAFRILGKAADLVAGIFKGISDYADSHPWVQKIGSGIMWLVSTPLKLLSAALGGIANLLDRIFPPTPKTININPNMQSAAMKFVGAPAMPVGVLPYKHVEGGDNFGAAAASAGGTPEAYDPRDSQNQQLADFMKNYQQSQKLEVTVKAAPGTEATVGKSSNSITPRVTSAGPGNY